MTEQGYIEYLIKRYEAILLLEKYPQEYYKDLNEYKKELQSKINELKLKLTK
jgi:hypothetical protein